MAKSYKYNRSRKPISTREVQLRLTDCFKALEPVILGGDYDRADVQLKIQCTYALSSASSRIRELQEFEEIENRITELEKNMRTNGKPF